ncbi:uncharacterized protein ppp1r15b [Rhinoraja longicauda]
MMSGDSPSRGQAAGSFYSGLWGRLLSLLSHHRPQAPDPGWVEKEEEEETTPASGFWTPLGSAVDHSHWGSSEVEEEPGTEPPQCGSGSLLLGKVWSKAWLGSGWGSLGLARSAACYPRRVPPNRQMWDPWWTPDPPARLEKANLSIWTGSDLSLSAVQRMEKPSELSQFITVDVDHGYSSLEEEHTCPKQQQRQQQQQQQQQQVNWASDLSPGSASAAMTCSFEPGDLKDKEEESSAKSEEAVLLQLVDVDLPTCNRLEIEDKIVHFGDEEWTSSDDDETEDDSDEEEASLSISRPQCANKTIAYILGSPGSDEDGDSDDEESDWDDDGFDSDGSSELSDSDGNEILWSSLAKFADPYNLLNFQASIKTRHKLETRTVLESSNCQHPVLCFTELKDAEERMDSGFSDIIQDEPQTQLPLQRKCRKRVAFDDHVTEYYVSSEEIRKGPWEECARDRCRFQKRIKETEKSIGCCFTLEHRRTVLKRMQLVTPEQNSPLLL